MNNKSLKITRFLLFCLLSSIANFANATAIASAEATATLTITDISNITNPGDFTDLTIIGESEVLIDTFLNFTSGNASNNTTSLANPSGPIGLTEGDQLQLSAQASSNASPTGLSVIAILVEGLIDFINDSVTDTFEIAFSLDFNLSALANVSNTPSEDAFSFAEILLFDDNSDIDIFEAIEADVLFGPLSDSIVDNLDLFLTLVPESSNQLFLEVNAFAFTESVPEPSVFVLIALGLLIFSWQQRNNQTTSIAI